MSEEKETPKFIMSPWIPQLLDKETFDLALETACVITGPSGGQSTSGMASYPKEFACMHLNKTYDERKYMAPYFYIYKTHCLHLCPEHYDLFWRRRKDCLQIKQVELLNKLVEYTKILVVQHDRKEVEEFAKDLETIAKPALKKTDP
jgi:hypothetical protein